jgi:predicted RNA-binding protein with PIN domain
MSHRLVYIDAYNVLHKVPQLSRLLKANADAARRSLVTMLASRRHHASKMQIVFDSYGEPITGLRGIKVVFAMTRTADAWIRMQLEKETNPRSVLVVSSDHEVCSHAAAMGADVQRAEEYLGAALTSASSSSDEEKKETRTLSKGEIDEWVALFQQRDAR